MRTLEEITAEMTAKARALTSDMSEEDAAILLSTLPNTIQQMWQFEKSKMPTLGDCLKSSTTTNATTKAGSSNLKILQETATNPESPEEARRKANLLLIREITSNPALCDEVRKKFPPPNPAEQIAAEVALCHNCTGNCRRPKGSWYTYPYVKDDGKIGWRECKFFARIELGRKFWHARIPDKYAGKTLDDYVADESNRNAVMYARKFRELGKGAFFYGGFGTGKTFLAAIIAQEFIRDGKSVVFVTVPNLLKDIRATFDKNNPFAAQKAAELSKINHALEHSDLVVLDDFGMEKSTQWAGETLCSIINTRYQRRNSVTIVTSNYSPNELATHLNNATDGKNLNGSRIADRMREICRPVFFGGTSRR